MLCQFSQQNSSTKFVCYPKENGIILTLDALRSLTSVHKGFYSQLTHPHGKVKKINSLPFLWVQA